MEINKLFLDYILNRDIVSIKKHYKLDFYNFSNVYAFCLGFAEKNQDNITNYKHAKKAKEYKDLEENIKTLKHLPNRTMFYHFEAYNNGKKAKSELKTELQKEIYQALFTIDKTYIVKEMKLDSIEFLRQQAFHLGYCARNNLENSVRGSIYSFLMTMAYKVYKIIIIYYTLLLSIYYYL
jgi:hypothetical protein